MQGMTLEADFIRKKITIFIADDDEDDIFLFEQALRELKIDHRLAVASNGEQLVDMLNQASVQPDIVFMDINMPVMNGMEALVEIKKSYDGRFPIFLFSTTQSLPVIHSAEKLGANGFICKPAGFDALCRTLSTILSTDWHTAPHAGFFVVDSPQF